jgi:hypothetical protein
MKLLLTASQLALYQVLNAQEDTAGINTRLG